MRFLISKTIINRQACRVSKLNLTAKVQRKIIKAFEAIHSLNVIHGDVHAENILVTEDGQTVWIVDFEFADIIDSENIEPLKAAEMECVMALLNEIKCSD